MNEKETLEELLNDLRLIERISMYYILRVNKRLREIRLEDMRNNPEKYTYWQIKHANLDDTEKEILLGVRKIRLHR
ncbi:MAG: hypothetical protein IJX30_01355 [Clostridia bacterium]|nr:hypothetical protein [Clostridia bacterium]